MQPRPAILQASLQAVDAPPYLCEHMFPSLITALRSAAIRQADLAIRLLTLDAVRLPDRLFAPDPPLSECAAPASRSPFRRAPAPRSLFRTPVPRGRTAVRLETPTPSPAQRPAAVTRHRVWPPSHRVPVCSAAVAAGDPGLASAARRGFAAVDDRPAGRLRAAGPRRR